MQYSKPMIDLVYEIRRRVDAEFKPGIKLANPEMLRELAEFHHSCKDTVTKTLIKELLSLAGDVWLAQIRTSRGEIAQHEIKQGRTPRQVTKVYRGQISLVDAPSMKDPAQHKPVRIYRGQIVDY